jgi:hypothetical protein
MSSNKKFRIQNGVDITGEVVVGNQLVINDDGTIAPSSISDSVSATFGVETASLQTQIDALLSSSPEHLDTLQEIVALFQSEDNDLSTLINQNAAAVAALQTLVDAKGDGSQMIPMSTTISQVQAILAAEETTTSGQIMYVHSMNFPNAAGEVNSTVWGMNPETGELMFRLDNPDEPLSNSQISAWGIHVADNDSYVAIGIGNPDSQAVPLRQGIVYIYEKDENGIPSSTPLLSIDPPGTPSSWTGWSSAFGGNSTFGLCFGGDYLFVGEDDWNYTNMNQDPHVRVCVFDTTSEFSFVKEYTGAQYGASLGRYVHRAGLGDYVLLPADTEDKFLVVDTSDLDSNPYWVSCPVSVSTPTGFSGSIRANDTHAIGLCDPDGTANNGPIQSAVPTTAFVFDLTNGGSVTSTINNAQLGENGQRTGVSNTHAVFFSIDRVEVYNMPNLSYVGTIYKNVSQSDWSEFNLSGTTLAITCATDKCVFIYDLSSSFVTPTITINAPEAVTNEGYFAFGHHAFFSSVGGVSTTAVPTLETTSTSVVGALNDLHSTFSSISGGSCIDYNASTGVISIDETDAAANLHVATSGDANTLEGQSGDHYRLDVYDPNDTIIN